MRSPRRDPRRLARGPVLLAAAFGLLVPLAAEASGPAQEEQRRKQLEVLEELLSENVREYVDERVAAEMRQGAGEAQEAAEAAARASMVVRVGSISRAHGVFIDGYGVIFSLQIPQVGVLPRHFADRFRISRVPRWEYRVPEQTEESKHRVTARMVEGQTKSMEQQLRSLEVLLRRQLEEGGDDAEMERRLAEIEELRARFDLLSDEIDAEEEPARTETEAGDETVGTVAPVPETAEAPTPFTHGFLGARVDVSRLLEESRQRTAQAVVEATVETLAGFGSVIKGLDEDHRISVVIVPAATPFVLEHPRDHGREEFVVSVRYGDIRDLDDGAIDADEFRSRVQVHNRLGTEISVEADPDGR